jgi:hypothetical protein
VVFLLTDEAPQAVSSSITVGSESYSGYRPLQVQFQARDFLEALHIVLERGGSSILLVVP